MRESLTQRFTKFSCSYFFIFSFISSLEVKCSPKQNVFDSIIFFCITLKLLEKLLGSYHTGKLSPAKLADSVYRQFSTTKIFPVVIEFRFHGTRGASDKGSSIYQFEDYWNIVKLSCRPFTLNSYKAFLKNKNRSGKTLSAPFSKKLKKKTVIFITCHISLSGCV